MNSPRELDLSETDLRIVLNIITERAPERAVYAFGSRTTGQARLRSDLDLAIDGPTPLTLRQRALLNDAFNESDLPIKVDVVDMQVISPEFRQRIERDFVLVSPGVAKQEDQVLA